MTVDVKEIRDNIVPDNQELLYLLVIGEKEEAQKKALAMIVEKLYPIYWGNYMDKAQTMDQVLAPMLPKIQRLGITLPDYATSGKRFIEHVNALTGNDVK